MKKLKKILGIFAILIAISISLFFFGSYFGGLPEVVNQVNSGALGALFAAIITMLLLYQQTEGEQVRERNSKVFEKKLEIFENFLKKLEEIVKDNKIDIAPINQPEKDELKELIFQLALLKTHTKADSIDKLFEHILEIIKLINIKESKEESEFDYEKLREKLFEIVGIFKKELYPDEESKTKKSKAIKSENINKRIGEIIIEAKSSAKRNEFWSKLYKYLSEKNLNIKKSKEFDSRNYIRGIDIGHRQLELVWRFIGYSENHKNFDNFNIELHFLRHKQITKKVKELFEKIEARKQELIQNTGFNLKFEEGESNTPIGKKIIISYKDTSTTDTSNDYDKITFENDDLIQWGVEVMEKMYTEFKSIIES